MVVLDTPQLSNRGTEGLRCIRELRLKRSGSTYKEEMKLLHNLRPLDIDFQGFFGSLDVPYNSCI